MWQLPPPTSALLLDEVRGVQTWMFINSSNDIYSHELIHTFSARHHSSHLTPLTAIPLKQQN
jgi:hypothetical protein